MKQSGKMILIMERQDYCKRTDAPCRPEECGLEKESCSWLVRAKDMEEEKR